MAPYYQADRIKTPLIIFHGDADTSVPIHHGWMQFRALQQRTHTPVRFVMFPGEEHSLQKLSSRTRKIDEELAWFDQYLYKTNASASPWLKPGAPMSELLAQAKAKHHQSSLGEHFDGKLIPEVVRFQGLLVGRFEITGAQWAQFDPAQAVTPGRENFPANSVTFEGAKRYCEQLSSHTGHHWRLPTEAEASKLYEPADGAENTLDRWAGYPPNAEDADRLRKSALSLGPGGLLQEVGRFSGAGEDPIFDLGGNVAEWIVLPNGNGRLVGGSADQPKDALRAEPKAGLDYRGLRVIRD